MSVPGAEVTAVKKRAMFTFHGEDILFTQLRIRARRTVAIAIQ